MEISFANSAYALFGSLLTVITAFIIKFYAISRRSDNKELQEQLRGLRAERTAISNDTQAIRDDLQKQIYDLRKHILDLQAANINYVRENAELKQQVIYITNENIELKVQVNRLKEGYKQNAQLQTQVKLLESQVAEIVTPKEEQAE